MKRLAQRYLTPLFVLCLTLGLQACGPDNSGGGNGTPVVNKPSNAIEITMAYSSEKKPWITPLVDKFNQLQQKAPGSDRPIFVTATVVDSGVAADALASGSVQYTVWSPSSSLWISVVNYKADKNLLDKSPSLLNTPVVLAMWKPMAVALGWPSKPIGLSDIIALDNDPQGWGSKGHPEWGKFKYAHTNPDVSSTGLSIVTAEFYAAAGKTRGLTEADVNDPKVKQYIQNIENSIVHYSPTTTVFANDIKKGGINFISAVALEEETVIDLNKNGNLKDPLVAIYPKEGTFYHDNPFIIPNGGWVTAEQRAAASVWKDYLLTTDSQRLGLSLGFRPANPDVAFADPLTAANGVDISEPKTVLEVPGPKVLVSVKDAWKSYRKQANIILILDVSGSMGDAHAQGSKLYNALQGLKIFLSSARPEDRIGFVDFSDSVDYAVPIAPYSENKAKLDAVLNGNFNQGSTALYAATLRAAQELDKLHDTTRINAIVVLTDGQDNASPADAKSQLSAIVGQNAEDISSIRIFPIAYGSGSDVDVNALQQMADMTHTVLSKGDASDIRKVYDQISQYF